MPAVGNKYPFLVPGATGLGSLAFGGLGYLLGGMANARNYEEQQKYKWLGAALGAGVGGYGGSYGGSYVKDLLGMAPFQDYLSRVSDMYKQHGRRTVDELNLDNFGKYTKQLRTHKLDPSEAAQRAYTVASRWKDLNLAGEKDSSKYKKVSENT